MSENATLFMVHGIVMSFPFWGGGSAALFSRGASEVPPGSFYEFMLLAPPFYPQLQCVFMFHLTSVHVEQAHTSCWGPEADLMPQVRLWQGPL